MAVKNILVQIHGMTTVEGPMSHKQEYDDLLAALLKVEPTLKFDDRATVEWGHWQPDYVFANLRPDQRIAPAEKTISAQVSYQNVAKNRGPLEHILGPLDDLPEKLTVRHVTEPVKESAEIYGVTDVIYYASPDGEESIRNTVYGQVLSTMGPFRTAIEAGDSSEVRLHLIAHSLGVTIAFDFLFGLFAPDEYLSGGKPGFVSNKNTGDGDIESYMFWREQAKAGRLTLGSKVSAASQLPLLIMRKQKLVDQLARGELLDPVLIGIKPDGPVCWRLYYQVEDILGFPSRRLFRNESRIEEFEVYNSWRPDEAHTGYWNNDVVIKTAAALIKSRLSDQG